MYQFTRCGATLVALLWFASDAFALDVNVLDAPYLAAGDGATNDRPAIQSAIDAVAANGGGTVTLPGGHTYLSGNLLLKSGVTLHVAQHATLLQSQALADYANPPTRGRKIPGSTIPFITYLDQNYPFVYAGDVSGVAVTGLGKIQMSYAGDDESSILLHAIGAHRAANFAISDITIAGASAYNVTIRNSERGEIARIKTIEPNTLNSDGISLMNSSHIEVHDNQLTTLDDGIYVWASYDDPRRSAWWNSDTPRPSHDIHVHHNVVDNRATNGSHGFLFINWTVAAPDKSLVEISRVDVHDNTLRATFPLGALNLDIYHSASNHKTPSKDLRFANNTLVVVPNSSPPGQPSSGLNQMATTGLSADDAVYNFARSTHATGPYNTNFDGANAFATQVGTSFWSTEGGASAESAAVGQPGGRYGQIAAFHSGYAGIYQGVYLEPGRYTFTASVQSSGVPIRLFSIRATTIELMGSAIVANTAWETQTITFDVAVADTYRLGIDNWGSGNSASSFGRIDATALAKIN